ncbi:hypothetical protein [Nocardioides halotolerans]|uniref:hypothetical protein n=1 Tax=Nocardioides halotolerans TaxID=433660 RepID=UPI0004165991|nr:hypothetical protein [Nocardioides halotolerans]
MTTFAMPDPHPAIGALLAVTASRNATVELTADTLTVRLGLTWHAEIPRASITSAAPDPTRRISIGAHGWRGDWLVNTSTRGLVVLTIDPPAPAAWASRSG